MSVKVPVIENGKVDVYVDNIITIVVDSKENLKRITRAPITAIHAVADRSTFDNTAIKRKEIVSDDKIEAEGSVEAAEKEKICLGWL